MARELSEVVRDAREREEQEAPPDTRLRVMRVTTLADLRSGSVPATMVVRGMPINIEYDPDGVTLESLQRASALQDGGGTAHDLQVLTDFLTNTITWWDLRESADGGWWSSPPSVWRSLGLASYPTWRRR
jgi:hypothetical protein